MASTVRRCGSPSPFSNRTRVRFGTPLAMTNWSCDRPRSALAALICPEEMASLVPFSLASMAEIVARLVPFHKEQRPSRVLETPNST
jgi:hypothetical protein